MILTIDTASNSPFVSLGEKKLDLVANQSSQESGLLVLIVKLLKETGLKLEDIDEIKINPGPGSFTGLRVGFSVANILGWYLQIPVNGTMVTDSQVPLPEYE